VDIVWTDLGALRYDVHVHFSKEKDDYSAVIWPATGRFKNEKGSWNHYMIPNSNRRSNQIRCLTI
jgi:hypothetical protein